LPQIADVAFWWCGWLVFGRYALEFAQEEVVDVHGMLLVIGCILLVWTIDCWSSLDTHDI